MTNTKDDFHFQPSPYQIMAKINEIKDFVEDTTLDTDDKIDVLNVLEQEYEHNDYSRISQMMSEFIRIVLQAINPQPEPSKNVSPDDYSRWINERQGYLQPAPPDHNFKTTEAFGGNSTTEMEWSKHPFETETETVSKEAAAAAPSQTNEGEHE